MNTAVDMRLMESLTLDELNDFNSIEIDNVQLQNNDVIQNVPGAESKDEKLIVLSSDSTKTDDYEFLIF